MATLSSILAWETPWTEEPGGLQYIGLQKIHTTEQLKNNKEYSSLLAGEGFGFGEIRA